MENIKNIAIKIAENCDRVKRCINDEDYLCDLLNSIEHKDLKEYYNSDKKGPIVDIRKKVCEELLLRSINKNKLNEIISNSRLENPNAFKSWSNNFNILNSILLNVLSIEDIDELLSFFNSKFDNKVKNKIWNFGGARNQGQDHYCILFYNELQESHSSSLQFFIDFKSSEEIKYGVWKESERIYVNGYFSTKSSSFESIIDYVDNIKLMILEDIPEKKTGNSEHTFISAAIKILKDFENKPMSAREIWSEIEKAGIYRTDGKTPTATLNSVMLKRSINSKISKNNRKLYFECVGENPVKFRLTNYMPKRVKETMLEEGFITIQQLKEILEKNNIKIEI